MLRNISLVSFVVLAVSGVVAADPQKPRSLAEAVKEFNQKAMKDSIGKDQPPLTEDEVVAAIRGWDRKQMPASDATYNAFQNVAKTKQLTPTAELSFKTRYHNSVNGLHFEVWWIDLMLTEGSKHGYVYRLRARWIQSRPIDSSDDVLTIPGKATLNTQ